MVTLLTGPGSHAFTLATVLGRLRSLEKVVSYYPDWEVRDSQGQVIDKVPAYRWMVWLLWAVWRRIPILGRGEEPRVWHFALYDWLVRQRVKLSSVVWAWWGTSLETMRKAHQEGSKVLLEAPACHPKIWNTIAIPLYREHFPKAQGTFAILPTNYVARLEAELKEADRIQVLSSFAKRTFIEAGIPEEKLYVLPLGIDTTIFYPEPMQEKGKFIVLYVGRIDPLKGVQYLLEAFFRLRLSKAELWLIGPILPEMRPLLRRYESDSIRYLGAKSQTELRAYYNQASIVVFPTLLDSFGLVMLEAMACAKPIIATYHSGAPDIFTGSEGILVPPASREALMEAIEWIYRQPKTAEAMGQAAYKRVCESYTLASYEKRVHEYLRRVVYALA